MSCRECGGFVSPRPLAGPGRHSVSAGVVSRAVLEGLQKFMTLEAVVRDPTGKQRGRLTLALGILTYCYAAGAHLCIDLNQEGRPQVRRPEVTIMSLGDSGCYRIRDAEDLTPESECDFSPMPLNHTFMPPCKCEAGQKLVINTKEGWYDTEVVHPVNEATGHKYKLKVKGSKDGDPRPATSVTHRDGGRLRRRGSQDEGPLSGALRLRHRQPWLC